MKILFCLLSICLSSGIITAQSQKIYTSKNKLAGGVNIDVNLSVEESLGIDNSNNLIKIDVQNIDNPKIDFNFSNFKLDKYKTAILKIKPSWIKYDNSKINLINDNKEDYKLEQTKTDKTTIPFKVIGNGETNLIFGYTFNRNAKKANVKSINYKIVISGYRDEVQAAIDKEWNNVKNGAILKLKVFINKNKNTKDSITLQRLTQAKLIIHSHDSLWNIANEKNRIGDYADYTNRFPNGEYVSQALEKKNNLIKKNKGNQQEEELWASIQHSKSKEDFLNYATQYPKGTYIGDVNDRLKKVSPITYQIVESSSVDNHQLVKLKFYNTQNLYLKAGVRGVKVAREDKRIFNLKGNDLFQKEKIIFQDDDWNKKLEVDLSERLEVELLPQRNKTIKIQGGIPPYRIELLRRGQDIAFREQQIVGLNAETVKSYELSNQNLKELGMLGEYDRIRVWDKRSEEFVELDVTINISSFNYLYLLLGLCLLGLVGGGFFYWNWQKKNKIRVQYQASMKDNMPIVEPEREKIKPGLIQINKERKNKKRSEIKVRLRKNTENAKVSKKELEDILTNTRYVPLHLESHWDDTSISEVYLNEKCISDLHKFLKEENLDVVIEEQEGMIPEVGGFLMGNYAYFEKEKQYKVTVDEFVPFVPEYHDVYKIEIGTATLARELGDAQDRFPNKTLIGWFHTHPGHGLFLSSSDISVHKHFPQKFQLAMEIDSLTQNLDTAFFTRNKTGKINNSNNLIPNSRWFSWKEIERYIREES